MSTNEDLEALRTLSLTTTTTAAAAATDTTATPSPSPFLLISSSSSSSSLLIASMPSDAASSTPTMQLPNFRDLEAGRNADALVEAANMSLPDNSDEYSLEGLQAILQDSGIGSFDDDGDIDGLASRNEDLPPLHFCETCLDVTGRLLCVPFAFIVTVTTVATVLSFCVLPSILLIGVALAFYYCCTSEPIPARVLLRAMLLDDSDAHPDMNNLPTRTKAEIHDLLLRRTCLVVTKTCKNTDNATIANTVNKQNGVKILVVDTADRQLIFSESLAPHSTEHSTEKEATEAATATTQAPVTEATIATTQAELPLATESSAIHGEIELSSMSVVNSNTQFVQHLEDSVSVEVPAELEGEKKEVIHSNHESKNNMEDSEEINNINSTYTLQSEFSAKESNESEIDVESKHQRALMEKQFDSDKIKPNATDHSDNQSETSSMMQHERGTACDICLRLYCVGDIVAWSHNPACNHAYHCDCITDWLLQGKNCCPNCRSDFLYVNGSRPRPQRHQSITNSNNRTADENNNSNSIVINNANNDQDRHEDPISGTFQV